MFSPPVYLSVGDEYDKREPKPEAPGQGSKTFVVPAKRHPHISDSTFDNFVSLSAGDPYQAVGVSGPFRKSTTGGAKSDVPPFRPPGASHKSSGKGDYYGTFCEKNPPKHEAEFPPIKPASAGPQDGASRRNFVTNRTKKGTYGYTGLTIAQAGEVQYVSDPYEGSKRKEALQKKLAAQQRMGAPFRAAVKSGGCFDETDHGFSKVYSLSKPLAPKKPQVKASAPEAARPWVPGGALGKEITKFPEYQEDPYDVKERKVREMRQKESSYKAWHPVGNDPWRHIYTKPINYNPPPVQ